MTWPDPRRKRAAEILLGLLDGTLTGTEAAEALGGDAAEADAMRLSVLRVADNPANYFDDGLLAAYTPDAVAGTLLAVPHWSAANLDWVAARIRRPAHLLALHDHPACTVQAATRAMLTRRMAVPADRTPRTAPNLVAGCAAAISRAGHVSSITLLLDIAETLDAAGPAGQRAFLTFLADAPAVRPSQVPGQLFALSRLAGDVAAPAGGCR